MLLKDVQDLLIYRVNNSVFEVIGIVNAEVINWGKYFNKFFEVTINAIANEHNLNLLQKGNIVCPEKSNNAAIIDIVEVIKNENGSISLQVKGRTLECLLDRRILEGRSIYTNTYSSDILWMLVNRNFVVTMFTNKRLPYIKCSDDYPDVGSRIDRVQITGNSIYDNIKKICDVYPNLGYEMQFVPEDEQIIFQILEAQNHTIDSESPVVFSSDLENILTSDYYTSSRDYKNVAYVAGEGQGASRIIVTVGEDNTQGYDRFEHYVDARDLQKEQDGSTLTDQEYRELLKQRGMEKLSGLQMVDTISGKLSLLNNQYVYGQDYKVGDWVTIIDKDIGIQMDAQITGLQESISDKYEAELIVGYDTPTIAEKIDNIYG